MSHQICKITGKTLLVADLNDSNNAAFVSTWLILCVLDSMEVRALYHEGGW